MYATITVGGIKSSCIITSEQYLWVHRIASIKQALGMCLEAIDDYKGILETTPNYLPALKGGHDLSRRHFQNANIQSE